MLYLDVSGSVVQLQQRVNGNLAFLWETGKFDHSQRRNPLAD